MPQFRWQGLREGLSYLTSYTIRFGVAAGLAELSPNMIARPGMAIYIPGYILGYSISSSDRGVTQKYVGKARWCFLVERPLLAANRFQCGATSASQTTQNNTDLQDAFSASQGLLVLATALHGAQEAVTNDNHEDSMDEDGMNDNSGVEDGGDEDSRSGRDEDDYASDGDNEAEDDNVNEDEDRCGEVTVADGAVVEDTSLTHFTIVNSTRLPITIFLALTWCKQISQCLSIPRLQTTHTSLLRPDEAFPSDEILRL